MHVRQSVRTCFRKHSGAGRVLSSASGHTLVLAECFRKHAGAGRVRASASGRHLVSAECAQVLPEARGSTLPAPALLRL